MPRVGLVWRFGCSRKQKAVNHEVEKDDNKAEKGMSGRLVLGRPSVAFSHREGGQALSLTSPLLRDPNGAQCTKHKNKHT